MKAGILLYAPLATLADAGWPGRLLESLPYARRLALEARATEPRRASLSGLALALHACTRVGGSVPVPGSLATGESGKPRFAGVPDFSISHCESHVACVAAAVEVGLDIETVPDASRRADLARWTATEAVIKAAGVGLRAAGGVEFAADGTSAVLRGRMYAIRGVDLGPGLVAHVASEEPLELSVTLLSLADAALASTVERGLGLAAQR